MPQELSAFATRRCLDEGLLVGDRGITLDTTVLFVDLAGFTTLTESLGRFGSRGTEQLSNIIGAFFGDVTQKVLVRGGDPVAYGGDALTITFDGSPTAALHLAASSAEEIHRLTTQASTDVSLAGPVALSARVGIAIGSVSTAVASTNHRAIPVNIGTGLDEAVAAEERATSGQTVFGATADAAVHGAGTTRFDLPGRRAATPTTVQTIERLLHPIILDRLITDTQLPTSHRTVTVAFVGFRPVAPSQMAEFVPKVDQLLELANDNGGEVVQVSGGDKGIVAMVVFGAPVAHDDDPLRAVQTMLEVRREQPSIRVGIATGPVFATYLGSPERWFPAHFGNSVNLAARLMQRADERQIFACPKTWRSTASFLRQRGPSQSVSLKGFAHPLEVHAVAGWRSNRRAKASSERTTLVGRTRELARIEQFFDTLGSGPGGALAIRGEAGIGKSRLTDEALEVANTRGILVLQIDADDIPRTKQHRIWRNLLSQRLNISETASIRDWAEALSRSLPHSAEQLHLVGRLIGVRLSHSASIPGVPHDVEVELAQDMLCQILVDSPRERGVLFVFENTHLFDSRSQGILRHLSLTVTRSKMGLLSVGRQGQVPGHDITLVPNRELILDELDIESAAKVAHDYWERLGAGTAPDWLTQSVISRAGGNPLFIRVATRMLWESWEPGTPAPRDPIMDSEPGNLLAERIDTLHAPEQRVLNVLATNANPCGLNMLGSVLADRQAESVTADAVDTLEENHLVRHVIGSDPPRFRIKHESLQSVVYERISHADRRSLHDSLASELIAERGQPLEIAHHVQFLDDSDLQRKWFPLAAASARDSWLVSESIDWWRRALPLLSDEEYEEAEASLLELLLIGGLPKEALELFDARTHRTEHCPVESGKVTATAVRSRLAVAEAALASGDFQRCDAEARLVMDLATAQTRQQGERATEVLVNSLCETGSTATAIDIAQKQVHAANRSGSDASIIIANASLGAALFWSGNFSDAIGYYEIARAKAQYVGDAVHEIHVLSDLSGCVFELGDQVRCLELLGEARRLAEDIGYRRHLIFSLTNEAQVRLSLGDRFGTACHGVAFQRAMELGDVATAVHCLECWVEADGRLAEVPVLWERLIAVNLAVGREHVAEQLRGNLAIAIARSEPGRSPFAGGTFRSESGAASDDPAINRRLLYAQVIADSRAPAAAPTPTDLLKSLDILLADPDAMEVERAEFSMEKWRIRPDGEAHHTALTLLREAFDVEPSAIVRSWFSELNEPTPTPPRPLPPPVGIGEAEATPEQARDAIAQLEEAVGLRHSG